MVDPSSQDLDQLHARVASLEEEVRALDRRVGAAEKAIPATFWHIAEEAEAERRKAELVAAGAPATAPGDQTTTTLAPLIGRTLVVLGGAFLLRALTDGDVMSTSLGVAAGLAYAGIWLWGAARAARLGRRRDAAFHTAATSVIAFPLIAEGTTHFGVLSPLAAALATLLFGGVSLWVAWRRRLRVIAWLAVAAAILVDAWLVLVSGAVVPLGGALCLLGGAAVVVSYARDWPPLRWSVTLLVALTLIAPPITAAWHLTAVDPIALGWLQIAVAALVLGGLAVRVISLRQPATGFDIVSAGVFLLIAFEVAPRLIMPGADRVVAFGVGALLLLLVAVVASTLARVRDHFINVGCMVGLGAFMVVEGFRHLLPGSEAAVAWTVAAVVGAWFGSQPGRPALRAGVAALLLAAVVGSGLLRQILGTLLLGVTDAWAMPSVVMGVVVAGAVACYVLLRREGGPDRASVSWTLPGLAIVLVLGLSLATLLVRGLAPSLAGAGTLSGDAGLLAILRTTVLALLVWTFAWVGRARQRPELLWAMIVVLVITAPKLVLDDLMHGRPATLFGTFILLGVTMMALPLLLRRRA